MNKEKSVKIEELRTKLNRFPKVCLDTFLTPIVRLERISDDLEIEVFVKKEYLNGVPPGGHYAHALEYVFGDIIANGYISVIHGGPSQSNQCAMVTAASTKYGFKTHLVLRKQLPNDLSDRGNLYTDQLYGADIRWVTAELGPEIDGLKKEWYGELSKINGERPYLFEREKVDALSCLGMLELFLNTYEQLDVQGEIPSLIYVVSCGPTQSGFLLGTKLINPDIKIVGVREIPWDAQGIISKQVNSTAETLEEKVRVTGDDIVNYPEFVGEGYGLPTEGGAKAIKYFAEKGAILLEPVYTAKMADAFLTHARDGTIRKGTKVLILHSGGSPLTYAYSEDTYGRLGKSLKEFAIQNKQHD